MPVTPALIGNYRIKYGAMIDSLPEIGSLADLLPFQPKEMRPGEKYHVPFLAAQEHGQTASSAGGLFTYNKAISAEVPFAEVSGSTIMLRTQFCWDDIYASLNGTDASGGGQAGAYQDIMSLKTKSMGMSGSLYRDLALAYGCGSGSVLASNIGVIKTTGTAVNTSPSVFLTKKSWIAGLWPSMKNALVDIYQSDLTTLRAGAVQILGVPNQNQTLVKFGVSTVVGTPTVNPTALITANDVIVPYGWKGNCCLGIEAMMGTQSGTIFGVDITANTMFRTLQFDNAGAALSRALIRSQMTRARTNGSKRGGKYLVAGSQFDSLAEEFSAVNRDTTQGGAKRSGESSLTFETPAGDVEVTVWDLAKQGQGIYIANTSKAYRVGTTDNTMRPIKGFNEGFLVPLIDQSGAQSCLYSNQAPFVDNPWHNVQAINLGSTYDIVES